MTMSLAVPRKGSLSWRPKTLLAACVALAGIATMAAVDVGLGSGAVAAIIAVVQLSFAILLGAIVVLEWR